jgi:hypothetical protein
MPDSQVQDSYIKPPVKILTRDLTESYVKEIVKEAAKQALKNREDAEKLDQAWNSASEQDKEKYLQELEKKITKKIQEVSTNELDIIREVSEILEKDFDPAKMQKLSQRPSNINGHIESETDTQDKERSFGKGTLQSYWIKGFLGLILIAVVIYFAIPFIFPAQLTISSTNLDFGIMGEETLSPLRLTIDNQGKDTLTWKVESDQPWIAVNPSSGKDNGVVLVAIQGSMQPGDQQGIIYVRSNAGDQQVKVKLHVETPPEPGVYPESAAFVKIGQKQPISKTLSISNSGEIPLRWTANADRSWIALQGNEGTNNGDIRIDIVGNQDPGTYNGTITIQSNSRSLHVPISLEVRRPPQLTVRPNPLVFNFEELYGWVSQFPEHQTMTIRNNGGDVLNWLISQDPWITIDPSSGSLQPGETSEVKVSIKQDLRPRNYSGVLSISSNGGDAKGTVELKRTETVTAIARSREATATAPDVTSLNKPA